MSPRSGGALGLGLVALAASWLLGSTPLTIVGVGLVLAGGWARVWSRRAVRGLTVERRAPPGRQVEGEDVQVDVVVRRSSRLPAGSTRVAQELGAVGALGGRAPAAEVELRGSRARVVLESVPRGRYVIGSARVTVTDPLGLARVAVESGQELVVVVDPRIEELPSLFSDAGAWHDGRVRARLRRPGGLELHSVREYQAGEPLRSVHWPSTARRAQLMVKELDDVARDDVVVVLDQRADAVAGRRGSSSLDEAVRAAGSIARAYAGRGRRVALQLSGGSGTVVRLSSLDRDWIAVLDVLAAVEPDSGRGLAAVLADPQLPAARAPELVVITASAEDGIDRLAERAREGRTTSLVAVDAPTFAGAQPRQADPALLRLSAAGVRVAVLRQGAPLARALLGAATRAARG